ncbi:hypothetical protein [Polynucleobacter necessarius]|uniref:hypothetical protein n=1 Tax=Polynucleobacter necessarius TaxID=576610 RepID=UPI001E34A4A1|nr:hypothetical protein [Polynucleobacter necessarius]
MKIFAFIFRCVALRLIVIGMLTGATVNGTYAQKSGVPINAAASVNGTIISNNMVEQGIRVAISQG